MKRIVSVMCLSYVSGMYEIAVEKLLQHYQRYPDGSIVYPWCKEVEWTETKTEAEVRSLLTDAQWEELMHNDIIECNIVC